MELKSLPRKKPFLFLFLAGLLLLTNLHSGLNSNTKAQTAGRGLRIQVKKWPDQSKRWALVIGVNKYADEANLRSLNGAVNDARALKAALVNYAGFPENQVILLTTDQTEKLQPTRNNILRELGILRGNIPQDGLLLLSFSGHGMERGGQVFLAPSDTQSIVLEQTALNATTVMDMIKEASVAQVVMLLDACRNNPSGRGIKISPLTETYKRAFEFDEHNKGISAFVTLYATGMGQVSQENPDTNLGYFTEAIVEALKGEAANENGEITLKAIVDYVEEVVPKRTRRAGGQEQKPYENIYGYRAQELVIAMGTPKRLVGGANQISSDANSILKADPTELAEVVFWNSIATSKNPEKFEAYLQQYPNGRFATLAKININELKSAQSKAEVAGEKTGTTPKNNSNPRPLPESQQTARLKQEQAESDLWNSIIKNPTIPSLQDYLRQYPSGRYAVEAQTQVESLKEDIYWNSIASSKTSEPFAEYLKKYANGRFSKLAKSSFDELQEAEYWNSIANSANPEAFNEYLRRYPNGKYIKPARASFDKLTEMAYWNSIKNSRNSDAFNEYINKYPNGQFAGEAKTKLEENRLRLAKEAEVAEWNVIAGSSDAKAFEAYLRRYPNGQYTGSAKKQYEKLTELSYWKSITDSTNPDAFREYMSKYPAGQFAAEAKAKLEKLKEDQYWNWLSNAKRADDIREYVRLYPNGQYVSLAKSWLEEIAEETYWNSVAGSPTLASFTEYLRRYPNGKHSASARTRLDELQSQIARQTETAEWKLIIKNPTAVSLNDYLMKYPDGQYAPEARTQIARLKEIEYWNTIAASTNAEVFKEYLKKYPNGQFAALAKERADYKNPVPSTQPTLPAVEKPVSVPAANLLNTANSHIATGNRLLSEGKWKDAESEFRQTLRLAPTITTVHTALAAALFMQNNVSEAELELREAVRLKPDDAENHANLAKMLERQAEFQEAEGEYRKALQLEPNSPPYHAGLGFTLYLQQKWSEAESEYKQAVRLEPNNGHWHTGVAAVLLGQQRLSEAEIEFRQALRLDPTNARWHANLAFALGEQQRWTEAEYEYRKATGIEPANLEYQRQLKQVLAKTTPRSTSETAVTSRIEPAGSREKVAYDTEPIPLNRPRHRYNEAARKNKVEGIVRTRLLVDSDGTVKKVEILNGLPDGLNEEAERTALQMRFKPAMKNGQAVAAWIIINMEFKLK
jgi:TonB family protein